MSTLRKTVAKVAGNRFTQELLEKGVTGAQFLMGFGSGTSVESSGESAVFNFVHQKQKAPYCIFDVGSNQGQYLRLILQNFPEDNLSVHCFEPSSYTFEILESSVEPKAQSKVKLNNLAFGKTQGELTLHYNKAGSGLASLTKRRLEHFGINFDSSEVVKVDTVDNYSNKNNVQQINLLKLDVEGHELDVLAGASEMFSKQAINIVSFEFGGCNIDTRTYFQDFYYFFKDINMSLFRIIPAGYLYPIKSYKEVFEQFRTTNYVAIKNE
ncbi:FkbM family methyltransferase [Nostocaceae cyanobacterium CENA369]|uniref:FkbM family methyltransferase n=1 Tax=Dendronalium phyllosphericum CENA369 TaxID=1725256 RepID=A0A8J7LDI2_9NOST|nr:FkbM family methyltransferase [Dendronalium phyllosphericum]MBH8573086.1 FkbM family methyltransferase [Dendronalium phyllosphericum CENA369]